MNDIDIGVVLRVIAGIWAVLMFAILIVSVTKTIRKKYSDQRAVEKRRARMEEIHKPPKVTPKEKFTRPAVRTPIKSIFDTEQHTHGSGHDEVEQVEEIVGSLGANYDEGCAHLSNIRILTPTTDGEGEEQEYEYDKIVSAVVFGPVLSEPKWKE